MNGTEKEKKLFAALEKLVGTISADLVRDTEAALETANDELIDSITQITEAAQEGENLMYELDPEWDMPVEERKGG